MRALLVFQGKMSAPRYSLSQPKEVQQLILDSSVLQVRPHVIGAVLRGVTFNKVRVVTVQDMEVKSIKTVNLFRRGTTPSSTCRTSCTRTWPARELSPQLGLTTSTPSRDLSGTWQRNQLISSSYL